MFEIRVSHLRVISSVLVNIGSALLLLQLTVRDFYVLMVSLIFGIICLLTAVRIEDILDEI